MPPREAEVLYEAGTHTPARLGRNRSLISRRLLAVASVGEGRYVKAPT